MKNITTKLLNDSSVAIVYDMFNIILNEIENPRWKASNLSNDYIMEYIVNRLDYNAYGIIIYNRFYNLSNLPINLVAFIINKLRFELQTLFGSESRVSDIQEFKNNGI